MEDLCNNGGLPSVMKYLLEHNKIKGECLTITGQTIEENLKNIEPIKVDNSLFFDIKTPLLSKSHIQVLYGNLAKKGSISKISDSNIEDFTGPSKVFDSENDMIKAVEDGNIVDGDVVVIRYQGPKRWTRYARNASINQYTYW